MSLSVALEEQVTRTVAVFEWDGMTHNMLPMARWAQVADAIWEPEAIGVTRAKQLIPLLECGLFKLNARPIDAAQLNPENGWGDYEGFVKFVTAYLQACILHPDARVKVCR